MSDQIDGYRIVKTKWADSAFDGEGARQWGGRWNSKGTRCVYLAGSESLATLEMLVHLNNAALALAYTVFHVSIPLSDMIEVGMDSLPSNWSDDPAPAETASLGDDWIGSMESAALWVPSTIIKRERNILLNPDHQNFEAIIKTATKLPFTFDPRLK